MTTELDRLELELRSVPGVVAVGYSGEGERLAVHVVAVASRAVADLADRVQRAVHLCAEPVELDLLLDVQA